MAVTITVFLRSEHLVSGQRLTDVAHQMGLDLSFPSGFDPSSDFGYIPASVGSRSGGFEFSLQKLDAARLDEWALAGAVLDGRDLEASFEARSSAVDLEVASAAAGALCFATDGLLSDDGEQPVPAEGAGAWIRSAIGDAPEQESAFLRVPAQVVGPSGNNFLKLKLGSVKSKIPLMKRLLESVEVHQVPLDLRAPNSRFWLVVEDGHKLIRIERNT